MVNLDGWVVLGGIVVWFRSSLNDGVEGEGWSYEDEWDMEDFSRHSRNNQLIERVARLD